MVVAEPASQELTRCEHRSHRQITNALERRVVVTIRPSMKTREEAARHGATNDGRPHVVIIGGGFGGLEAAKALAGQPVRVTLVDRSNHHLFQPLLYQVAMAGLSPAEIAIPIRSVLRNKDNLQTLLGSVSAVHLDNRRIDFDDGGSLDFDYLVIAAGARPAYFGNDHWRAHAPPLKSVEDATEIRREILLAFERAERMANTFERKKELTLAIVGGGPTGVELAGAMVELSRSILSGDFRRIQQGEVRVVLIEGGDRLLPGMSEASSREAKRALEAMGVEVVLNRMARNIDDRGVHLDDGIIEAETVVWAAGVRASALTESIDVPKDRAGRIVVNQDCSLPGNPRAFAIGDIARFDTDEGPLPGISPVAMQQGRYVARKILRHIDGKSTKPFRYSDKGSMATIGRRRAVADILGTTITGYPAWLAWLFVHLFFLVGFKNRVFVLFQWIGAYVFENRGARLITHSDRAHSHPALSDRGQDAEQEPRTHLNLDRLRRSA